MARGFARPGIGLTMVTGVLVALIPFAVASCDQPQSEIATVRPHDTTPSAKALECLRAAIRYPYNPAVRVEAVEALEAANQDTALPWVRAALHDEHPAVRFAACVAVGSARDQVAADAIEKCRTDENPSVRVAALYARHRLGATDQTGKLATYLLDHENPAVRRNAALVLGLLGEPGATPILARAVRDDPEPGVRHHALEAMARLGNTEAQQELTFTANSGVGSDEVMAVQALANTRDARFVDTFRYKLATATHQETKLAAAGALGMLGLDDGLDLALKSLRGYRADRPDDADDPLAGQELRLKLLAASAIGEIGHPDSIQTLTAVLENDPDPRVQVAAARAILEIESRSDHLTVDTPFWKPSGSTP